MQSRDVVFHVEGWYTMGESGDRLPAAVVSQTQAGVIGVSDHRNCEETMKKAVVAAVLVSSITIASAQISVTDVNQTPRPTRYASEQVIPVARRSSQLSPMVSYTGYTVGGKRLFGAAMIMQYSLFRSSSEAIDLLGGVMMRSQNTSDPVNLEGYTPLGIERYSTSSSYRSPSYLKSLRFGLGFVGMDYTVYLTEGSLRPYVGLGGMVLAVPSQAGLFGTVAPDLKAGLLADFSSGFSGFVEVKHVFGLPLSFGSPATPFRDLTGLAFGFAFAPRFN